MGVDFSVIAKAGSFWVGNFSVIAKAGSF